MWSLPRQGPPLQRWAGESAPGEGLQREMHRMAWLQGSGGWVEDGVYRVRVPNSGGGRERVRREGDEDHRDPSGQLPPSTLNFMRGKFKKKWLQ